MAASVNKVILVGNLGKEPEVRHTPDGSRIVSFPVATTESWKDKNTLERKERTEWHKVVIFNDKIGEIAEKYLNKGSKVYLEGQLQTRKWTDQHGHERYTTEVILSRFRGELTLLDNKGGDSSYAGMQSTPALSNNGQAGSFSNSDIPNFDELNDEIPF